MKYFNKFQETLQQANVEQSLKEFLKIVAADINPLLPANLNEIGNKGLFGAFSS